jgi:hypothetical protein
MRDRLRYLAILLVSALAIVVGAWPSALTLGALLGLCTGLTALIGSVAPRVVDSRPVLRRFTVGGGAILALELLGLGLWLAMTPRRTVHLTVPSSAPRTVRIVYGVRDGVSSAPYRWDRHFATDSSAMSIIRTRLRTDDGWFRKSEPHPVVAETKAGAPVRVRWFAGGYAEAGRCHVAYDEFVVGDSTAAPKDAARLLDGGWLDSLSGWGVECRDGNLVRGSAGAQLHRTSPACYFDERGGAACGVSPGAS